MKFLFAFLLLTATFGSFGQNNIPYAKLTFRKDVAYYKDEPFSGVAIKFSERIPFKNGLKNGIQIDRGMGLHKIKYTKNYITKFCWLDSSLQDIFCVDSSSFSGTDATGVELGIYFANNNSDIQTVYYKVNESIDLCLGMKITYKNKTTQFIRISNCALESLEVSICEKAGFLIMFQENKLQMSFSNLRHLSTYNKLIFDGKIIINNKTIEVRNYVFLTYIRPNKF